MLRIYFQGQTIRDSKILKAIGLKRITSLNIINHKVNSGDKSILIEVKQIWKVLTSSIQLPSF